VLDLPGCTGVAWRAHRRRSINYRAFSAEDTNGTDCAESNRFHDLDLALLAENFHGWAAAFIAADEEVHGSVGEPQIFDLQFAETLR